MAEKSKKGVGMKAAPKGASKKATPAAKKAKLPKKKGY